MLILHYDSLMGFLLGSTLTGAGVYYYVLEEYKVSNELLTEDIHVRIRPYWAGMDDHGTNWTWVQALQSAVHRIHTYVQTLEEKMEALERKKR